jgi:hypothetical protein
MLEKITLLSHRDDTLRQIIAQGIIQVPVFFRIIPGGF